MHADEAPMRPTGMHGGVGKQETCWLKGRKGRKERSVWLFQRVRHTGLTGLTS